MILKHLHLWMKKRLTTLNDDYDIFGAGYDDEDLFDATADLLSNHPEKRRSHAEMDDTFKMDVIDLD